MIDNSLTSVLLLKREGEHIGNLTKALLGGLSITFFKILAFEYSTIDAASAAQNMNATM